MNIRTPSGSEAISLYESLGFVVFAGEGGRLNLLFACSRNPWLPSDAVAQGPRVQR